MLTLILCPALKELRASVISQILTELCISFTDYLRVQQETPTFLPKMDTLRKTYQCMYVQSQFYANFSVISILMNHFQFKMMRQEHSEDCNSNYNETAYNELFEMAKNYNSLQSYNPSGDNDYDLNTYSYNHLHEKALFFTTDVYDVVKPIIPSPVSSNECCV